MSGGQRGLAIHLTHGHSERLELFCGQCEAGPFDQTRHLEGTT